ncbi:MAG: DUF1016 N-terminal domain-containing protein [Rickettsia sp.]|uniref:DUF1016 N-terminal domain-containing protein n=1 Tax=Rickettsia sp. TaxID=789 RepID=UPI00397CC365
MLLRFLAHILILNLSFERSLLPLKEQNQRVFYAYMSIQENWSVRKLRSNIDKMLYERTKLSQKPNNEQVLSIDRFRN